MTIKRGLLLSGVVLLMSFTSCEIMNTDKEEGNTQTYTEAELAQELLGYRSLITQLEVGLMLGQITPSDSNVDYSRGISPPWQNRHDQVDYRAIFLKDTSDNSTYRTPEEVYNLSADELVASLEGGEVKRFPAEGYIQDYYNIGSEAYFTMEPAIASEEHFLVKLYVFPRSDFHILYTYEEYYVRADNWTEYPTVSSTESGFIANKTFYADGSLGDKSGLIRNFDTALNHYPMITMVEIVNNPENTQGLKELTTLIGSGVDEYKYPLDLTASVPELTAATNETFSSYAKEIIQGEWGFTTTAHQYYTEVGAMMDGDFNLNARSGITYSQSTLGGVWDEQTNSVSRLYEDVQAGELNVNTLTTIGNIGSIWDSEITNLEVKKSDSGDLIINRHNMRWFTDITAAGFDSSTNPAYEESFKVTQVAGGNTYTGKFLESWGSDPQYWDITYTLDPVTGNVEMVRSWAEDQSSKILLSSEDVSVIIEEGGIRALITLIAKGEVVLEYNRGRLIGYFNRSRSAATEIEITPFGVRVGGSLYSGEGEKIN